MKKRVLIVEDDYELRKVERIYLEDAGLDVYEATSIEEALKLSSSIQPHLLIIDIYLDGELGLDIAKKISSDHHFYGSPKIIAVSGTIGGELVNSEQFRKENGINIFIKKPFECPDLIETIKKILEIN